MMRTTRTIPCALAGAIACTLLTGADLGASAVPASAAAVRGVPARAAEAAPSAIHAREQAAAETETPPQAPTPPELHPLLRQVIGLYTGVTGTVDDPRAHDLLVEAAATGDPLSRMWLARCYSRGRMLFDRDAAEAGSIAAEVIDSVREAALHDSDEAAFLMGTAYAEGLGVEADVARSIAWYHRAADLGNVLAQHNLGNAYRQGNGVPRDPEMAAYRYRRAALMGDALTAFWLGQMYERGEGVEQSEEQALRWYRAGAARGNTRAIAAVERLGSQ